MPDSSSWTLAIGGVQFRVNWPAGLIIGAPDPGYEGFVNPVPPPASWLDLHVAANEGATPPLTGAECLFDGGESWTAWRLPGREGRRLVMHRPPDGSAPSWYAEMRPESTTIALHYGRRLLHDTPSGTSLRNPLSYPLDLTLLIYALAPRQGVILHGAGLAIGGRGYIFLGRSTAGKTTLMRLFESCPDVVRLSDDRLIVRETGQGFSVHGGPWLGNPDIAANVGVPLHGIFLLDKAPRHAIEPATGADAMDRVMQVASVPWFDGEWVPACLATCDRLIRTTPARRLGFAPTPDLVPFLLDRLV